MRIALNGRAFVTLIGPGASTASTELTVEVAG